MTFADAEKFVRLWWDCGSVTEFCRRSEIGAREACNWAAFLRRKGVPLKLMTNHGKPQSGWMLPEEWAMLRDVGERCQATDRNEREARK